MASNFSEPKQHYKDYEAKFQETNQQCHTENKKSEISTECDSSRFERSVVFSTYCFFILAYWSQNNSL